MRQLELRKKAVRCVSIDPPSTTKSQELSCHITSTPPVAERYQIFILLKAGFSPVGLHASTQLTHTIDQGGVKLDSEKVSDKNLQLNKGVTVVAQVGKRKFAKINLI